MKTSIALCLSLLSFTFCALAQDLFTIEMSKPRVSGTNLAWMVIVINNTDAEPTGEPYNDYIHSIILNDIYSDSPPRFGGNSGWRNIDVSEIYPDHYSITVTSPDTDSDIGPGSIQICLIFGTTVPDTNCVYRAGKCFGRALTMNHYWVPDDPGQSFVGPVGIAPLSGIESLAINNGKCELAITNTSAVWQHTVERNTQMDAPESWSPCHTFSADTNRYVWTETPSNGTTFYRIKSEYNTADEQSGAGYPPQGVGSPDP